MAEVIRGEFPTSATESERRRFEMWAVSGLRQDEGAAFLARSRGGDYVLATARAGWAAWQARGLLDERLKGQNQ